MREGKIISGETLDYEDIKHITGALYVGTPPLRGTVSARFTNQISWIRYCECDVSTIRRWLRKRRQSASVLETFLLAMTLNPDVYKKAQKVIDGQIGRDRLIEPSGRENLPYITCLLKEVLRYVRRPSINLELTLFSGRWGVPVPLGKYHVFERDGTRSRSKGIPHLLIQDDVYDGHLLPRCSSVFFNAWSVISYRCIGVVCVRASICIGP